MTQAHPHTHTRFPHSSHMVSLVAMYYVQNLRVILVFSSARKVAKNRSNTVLLAFLKFINPTYACLTYMYPLRFFVVQKYVDYFFTVPFLFPFACPAPRLPFRSSLFLSLFVLVYSRLEFTWHPNRGGTAVDASVSLE